MINRLTKAAAVAIAFCTLHSAIGTASAAYLNPQTGYVPLRQNSTTNDAWVIFSAEPYSQIRLVCLDTVTDTNDSTVGTVSLYAGRESATGNTNYVVGAVAVTQTTNLFVVTNYNFATGDVVVVQNAGSNTTWSAVCWGTLGTTAIVLTAAAPGNFYGGDNIYRMADVTVIRPLSTNEFRLQGNLFAAPKRQPLAVHVGGGGISSRGAKINSAVAVYDPSP